MNRFYYVMQVSMMHLLKLFNRNTYICNSEQRSGEERFVAIDHSSSYTVEAYSSHLIKHERLALHEDYTKPHQYYVFVPSTLICHAQLS